MKKGAAAGLVVGGFTALLLVPGVADAAQSVFINNGPDRPVPTQAVGTTSVSGTVGLSGPVALDGPVDVSGSGVSISNGPDSPVPVALTGQPAQPEPWQRVVQVSFPAGSAFGSGTLHLPADQAVTLEKVSVGDFFGKRFVSFSVFELCDFNDGGQGFGGATQVPVAPTLSPARQGLDHLTRLHVSPQACVVVYLQLEQALPSDTSGSTPVTLTGTSTSVPSSSAAVSSRASNDALERSLDDPAVADVLSPEAIAALRDRQRDEG